MARHYVYTAQNNPFAFGPGRSFIKTLVAEYERVALGAGYYGLLLRNPARRLWHLALEGCGALVATDKSRSAVLRKVRHDVETGDPALMREQIMQGKRDCAGARNVPPEEFWPLFSGALRRPIDAECLPAMEEA